MTSKESELQIKINSLQEELSIRDKQIENLKDAIDKDRKGGGDTSELQRQLNKKTEEINSLNTKNEGLKKSIAVLEEKIRSGSHDDDEKLELKEKLKVSENKVSDLNLKLAMMSSDRDEERKRYENEIQILKGSVKEKDETGDIDKDIKEESKLQVNETKNDDLKQFNSIEDNVVDNDLIQRLQTSENNLVQSKEQIENLGEINKNLIVENNGLKDVIAKLELVNQSINDQSQKCQSEKKELETKIFKMKETMQEIKVKLELELNQKVESRNKIIEQMKREFIQKEELLTQKNNKITKEKLELEEILIKQDVKMNEFSAKFAQVEAIIKAKNNEIKNIESQAKDLISIIEEQKKQLIQFKEEKKHWVGLEAELSYLRNYNESLKDDSFAKDEIIRQLKVKLTRNQKHSSPSLFVSMDYKGMYNSTEGNEIGEKEKSEKLKKVLLPPVNTLNSMSNSQYNQTNQMNQSKNLNRQNNLNSINSNPNLDQEKSQIQIKAYEDFKKIELEEKHKNDTNYSKINALMKEVLDE